MATIQGAKAFHEGVHVEQTHAAAERAIASGCRCLPKPSRSKRNTGGTTDRSSPRS
jgi:hypothetical protein